MKLKLLFTFLITALLTSNANAVDGFTISNVHITKIETGWRSEGIFISTDASNSAIPQSCGDANNKLVLLAKHPLLDTMKELLLLAFDKNYKVDLRINGCSFGTIITLQAVAIHK
jgi:hypothetical protein